MERPKLAYCTVHHRGPPKLGRFRNRTKWQLDVQRSAVLVTGLPPPKPVQLSPAGTLRGKAGSDGLPDSVKLPGRDTKDTLKKQ